MFAVQNAVGLFVNSNLSLFKSEVYLSSVEALEVLQRLKNRGSFARLVPM